MQSRARNGAAVAIGVGLAACALAIACDSGYRVDASSDGAPATDDAAGASDTAIAADGTGTSSGDAASSMHDGAGNADANDDGAADANACGAKLDTDPMNCGACGHVCNAGDCAGGECRHVVFLFTLPNFGGNLGGVSGADKFCQDAATSAGLHNKFLAWLGSSTTSPAARFVKGKRAYVLPKGTAVAGSWTLLTSGSLSHGISDDANGLAGTANKVWTNVATNGTSAGGNSCTDWTAGNGPGATGDPSSMSATWTQGTNDSCANQSNGIYCVEQ